jgi:hypothetical protein
MTALPPKTDIRVAAKRQPAAREPRRRPTSVRPFKNTTRVFLKWRCNDILKKRADGEASARAFAEGRRGRREGTEIWRKSIRASGTCKPLKSLKTAKRLFGKAWQKTAQICESLAKNLAD